ncbi:MULTISPECIES: HAEPLYID family protein [Empedobacter]|uniref:HAEPLYID family protein n=1 Tax=Empedobacter TaxID=59734 RepID=UPI0025C54999|nr:MULTISPECIES: HAEPLYID family protein [unclassified Empedobacter]
MTTVLITISTNAQTKNDSIITIQPQQKTLKPKIEHAEPLNTDLMRDLGARKGEAEINVGFGVASKKGYNEYNGFVEYEWTVADRLGLEVEVPFSFNHKSADSDGSIYVPNNKIEGLKLATQYTFLVNEKRKMSLAVAYVHEFKFNNLKKNRTSRLCIYGYENESCFYWSKEF